MLSPHCAGPLLLCVHSPLLPASPVLTNFNCSLNADKDENGSSIKDDKRPHRAPLPNSGRAAPPSSLYTPLPWVHPRFHRINFLVLKLDLEYKTGMTVMASVKKGVGTNGDQKAAGAIELHFSPFLCISQHLYTFLFSSLNFPSFLYISLHFSAFLYISLRFFFKHLPLGQFNGAYRRPMTNRL